MAAAPSRSQSGSAIRGGRAGRCALRSGNVHTAASWREVLEPVVARYRGTVKRCCFRGDAAFANP